MNKIDSLKFRRQFLFSAKKCKELVGWKVENLNSHYLYVHPDCELNKVRKSNADIFLIGNVINPYFPEKTSLHILNDISKFKSKTDIPKLLYSLVGRFVLLLNKKEEFLIYHDACGLKTVFYAKEEGDLYAASQPLLLKLVIDIKKNNNYDEYFKSEYVKSNLEHWMPSGTSLYENVYHLVPNHYLDFNKFEQIRYWPVRRIENKNLNESTEKISFLLKNTMFAASKKFQLALPLTAGLDSRLILSSCREFLNDVFVFTLQYRDLTMDSGDIKIPKKLSERLGFDYKVIDCRKPLDKEFADIYVQNTDIPHLNDWGKTANGMFSEYPQSRVAIKGNCVEIGRCAYYHNGKHTKIRSGSRFVSLINGWSDVDFIKRRILSWFEEVKDFEQNYGYDLFDLFYWEHRMGSWQSQSQLEWNIVREEFTPFNNREIIDNMLAVQPKYRSRPKSILFSKVIQKLWHETLQEPINPSSVQRKIKSYIKDMFISKGLYFGAPQKFYQRMKNYIRRAKKK